MDEDVYELIMRARLDIREGRIDDGLLILDRVVDRKWATIEECDGAYRMFNPDGGIDHMHNFFAVALGHQVAAASAQADIAA